MNLWKITVFLFFVAQCLATSEEDDLSKIKCGDMTSLDSEKNENEENDENSAPPNTNDNVQYKENELTENIIAEIPVVSDTDENDSNNSSQNVSDKTPIDEHLIEDNIIENESSSTEYQLEYLEESHPREAVVAIIEMPTLEETDVEFNGTDIKFLSKYCDTDEDCMKEKEESIKKYHQKMQAIQCIHGLLALKVFDDFKKIVFNDGVTDESLKKKKSNIQTTLERHQIYLNNMLCLLNLANWDAYYWQIELFTFVEGRLSPEANFDVYEKHYKNRLVQMQENVLAFVRKCVQHKYIRYQGNTTLDNLTQSHFVDAVYWQMGPYIESPLTIYFREQLVYNVENLMLQHLYDRHNFIFDYSMVKQIELETSNVERKLLKYVALYSKQHLTHVWELDPIGGNKYNVLIAKCIHLRLVYHVWYHLHIFCTLKSRPMDENDRQYTSKIILFSIWPALVKTLKTLLNEIWFNDNIYWSAISIMEKNILEISKEELATREEYTRDDFCQAVEELELASASDIDQQLKDIKVAEDHDSIYDELTNNATSIKSYAVDLSMALDSVDGTFIRLLVSAEGNDTFVLR